MPFLARVDEIYRARIRRRTKFGIAASSSGGLRLCPHIYNTREHIMRAVKVVTSMKDPIRKA